MAVDTETDRRRTRLLDRLTEREDRQEEFALRATGVVGFVAAWTIAARLITPEFMLPSPLAAASAFVGLFTATAPVAVPLSGSISLPIGLIKLLQSLAHYVPGLAIGAIVGIGLGISTALFPRLDALLAPIVRLLRPVPPLAWMAFAIVWFGIHHTGAAFIVFVGALWINFYGAYSGVKEVPERLVEVARTLGVDDTVGMVRRVILPSAAPQISTSFRTSVGRCWMILVGAELFGAPGVGYEIITAANALAMDVSVAYMLLVSGAFIAMDVGVRTVERRVLAWQ